MRKTEKMHQITFSLSTYQTIVHQSPISTQIFSPTGETIMVNAAWEQLWKITAKDIVHNYNVLRDKQLVKVGVMPYLKKAFKGNVVQIPPVRYEPEKTVPGLSRIAYRWVKAVAYPILDEKGKLSHVVLQHEDITEQKEAEEKLRERESYFSAVFNQSAVAMAIADTEGNWISFNHMYPKMFGYSEKELRNMKPTDLMAKEDRKNNMQAFKSFLKSDAEYMVSERLYVHKSGKPIYGIIHGKKIVDENGKVTYITTAIQDITKRKIAEEQVKESEAKFRKLFDANIIGVFISTFSGEFIEANDAFLEMIGYSRKELLQKKFDRDSLTPPEYTGLSQQAIVDMKKSGKSTMYEKEYIRKDGNRVRVLIAVAQLDDRDTCIGFVIDITARKLFEEARYRLAAIVDSSDDAIVSKTLNSVITSWNGAAEKLFGYTAKEAIGKSIYLIIPKELRDEEKEIISKLRRGIRIQHFETVRQRKDGSRVFVSLTISPVKDGKGNVIGASKIARDITLQKQSEQALRESEERLRLALQAGNIGVWDWQIETDTLIWTENVYRIHGVTKDSFRVTFKNYLPFLHPDDRQLFETTLRDSMRGEKTFSGEFRIITPAGDVRWVATRGIISYNEKGKPVRMLGATSDITQQKLLDQEKSDFLSMASHELKTPLTSMKMFIDLLQREVAKSTIEKPKYYVKRIGDQADRLSELTNDLLDVSRIETGKLRLHKENFRIDELIADTIEGIQPSTQQHTIEWMDNQRVTVSADRYRIYQVLVNLLTNAIKYSPNGKKILVGMEKNNKTVTVMVQDFGIGIKKDQQKKIFERLYQVTDPEEKTYPGLGLGLYISKEIIERHNGKLWVESKRGKGSTFSFSLPI